MREPQVSSVRLHSAFAALGVAFLAIFCWVFFTEYLAEWRTTQAGFARLEREVKDPHALSLAPPVGGIRQIWLTDLDRVDRCTTCHLGVDDPAFAGANQPFAAHPGGWLRTHPPDRYGCVTCHGGQGEATTYHAAAHRRIPYWSDTIRTGQMIEAKCGACHRERAVRQAFWLSSGRERIAAAGCAACHDIPGFSRAESRAPRLESVGYKLQPGWVEGWLANPRDYLSQARMPNFRLTPEEISGLSAFLLAQRAVAPLDSSAVDWTRADPARGRVLFREARCVTCHQIDGRGGTLGPELSQVGSKVRRDWLFGFLKDPMRDQPDTLMLRYRFTDDEIRDLAAYLTEELVRPDEPARTAEARYQNPSLVEQGRDAFVRHGCYGCHRFAGMENLPKIGPSLAGIGDRPVDPAEFKGEGAAATLPNFLFLKVRDPEKLTEGSRMPTYAFTELDTASVVLGLLSIRKTELPASRVTTAARPEPYEPQGVSGALMRRYRCLSCHQLRGYGGTLSTVPLDRIGSQLQRDYLVEYLQNPGAVRVALEERMPLFRMTATEAALLSDYMSAVFVDDGLDREFKVDADAARRGERLFGTLGCRSCHIVGGSGGYVGPDLSDTGRRLRPSWIEAWLSEPQTWKSGTLQPDYGLTGDEVRDLVAYLMTLEVSGKGARP
ncbi:MAG TPA: c-type cytochrome [Vicinamibacterales bacterium]|nr:c-type cytochrome [Vicinamibacterales bacterium]